MRIRLVQIGRKRKGLSLALVALMMPALMGFTGLCIDIGVLALARCHLQTVADAAALAGAKQLNDPLRVSTTYDLSTAMSNARRMAISVGQKNTVLGVAAVVVDNPNNDPAGDVVLGYTDTTAKGSSLVLNPSPASLVNSVQVTARRDATHSGLVPAFFSKAIGLTDSSVSVTSTATVQTYSIKGYKTTPPGGVTKLIPIALSQTTWKAMLAGQTTDTYTYSNKTVTTGPDGLFESSVFPVGSGAGNLGTVNIGASSNGTSALASQITTGVTTSDLAASAGSLTLNPSITMPGNPGVSLGLKTSLQGLVGKIVTLPVYDPAQSSGTGANFTYTIVAFAPVVVLNTYFNGIHSGVIVQPALETDPYAVAGTVQAWSSGGLVRLRLTR